MRNTKYNAFEIVIPGFSESESDIGNDMSSSNQKKDIQGISRICDNRLPYT